MSSLLRGIYSFEFTVVFMKSCLYSHSMNALYELRELYLFTIFLKFINIFPLQFSANGCTKKRMLGAVLVTISYPTEVALFILKQFESLNSVH